MSNFDAQLERMKSLMTYGQVNEDNSNHSNYSLEYKFKAADGKTYGIVKECSHYFIKQAENGKETIAEAYNYIGGLRNKHDYQYNSYANALKQFELKMASINEACDAKVDYTTLDPYKKENLVVEGTEKMKNEIARQRQIMYNACMIMNESADYAVKGGAACNDKQPEAETGKKGDEEYKEVKANPEYKGNKVGLDKKAEPFKEAPKCCKDQLKEDLDTDFDEGMDKGRDPKAIGWEMEGQETVNEEAEELAAEGLPKTPGVGEADNDKNNAPFDETVNEGCEEGCCVAEEDDDVIDFDEEEPEAEKDVDFDEDGEGDDIDFDEEGEEEEVPEDDAEEIDFDEEGEDDIDFDEEGEDDDLDFDEEGEEFDEEDPEAIRAEIERLQAKLAGLEGEEEELPAEDDAEMADDEAEEDFEDFGEDGEDLEGFEDEEIPEEPEFEGETDECGMAPMMEAKQTKLNAIVESVVRGIMNEDELHDFGKHPGYRKKPMELPATGEDKNQWGRDWNDDSAHNEEPFGQKIGNGAPFDQLVDAVTKDVLAQIKGEAFKADKKKAE